MVIINKKALSARIKKMTVEQRMILDLIVMQRMTFAQAAHLTGIPKKRMREIFASAYGSLQTTLKRKKS
jgi:DNA-directed RNA polymerase specialized sigma24 family protein